jgi:tRNA-dihydrouridine synthase C
MNRLHLAPMEGVVDWVMRDLLTRISSEGRSSIDQCVTEFMRVTTQLHPYAVFLRYAPELQNPGKLKGHTLSGTPVFFQLLGGQPQPLAENAARVAELGAPGIDLNFGCPAKTVNRHDGGATLLKCPERILKIVEAVRSTVPQNIPVTAKIRLGFDDPSICLEVAQAAAQGGADKLTVHCRTKTDGYRPPAYWEWLPKIREAISIPVVANGEIWTVQDFLRCREISGCAEFMIGRGALANPFLFQQIKQALATEQESSTTSVESFRPWSEVKALVPQFFATSEQQKSGYFAQARTKQWLRSLALKYAEAKPLFDEVKILTQPREFKTRLELLCQ